MAKLLLVSNNKEYESELKSILAGHELITSPDELLIIDILKVENPDIIIFDCDIDSLDMKSIYRQIKEFNVISILILNEKPVSKDILSHANMFLSVPFSPTVFKASINSCLKTKKSLMKLAKSNKELASSLYQLNVLYTTTSQLSGSLDKEQLISIMNEGIEKSLNYNLLCTLTFKTPKEPVLLIDSTYNPSDRLVESLKLRAVMNYKSRDFANNFNIDINDIIVQKKVKYAITDYDFEVLNFDNLLSFIDVNDECHGFTEIFREVDFTLEDSTCFQTIVQQVALPLNSAILYQEITDTNKKLAKLERLKSEFISIVSHELRTPLTTIKNSLDIITSGKTGELTENSLKFVNMAKRNVVRLSGIINDLLDISKIEAGKLDFKYALTKITPVVEYVKNNLQGVAKDKDIKIDLESGADEVEIYADANRLEQVLTNLVSNAIKFTPSGGNIRISTQLINSSDIIVDDCFKSEISKLDGDYVQVCVSDEGIGIEKENLKQVFDKFEQIENSLSREVGGSGLGLAIAKQLIESHNGAIWCDSVINNGSNFYFAIPVYTEKMKFLLNKKQLIQKAKIKNSTLLSISMKSSIDTMDNLLNEENLFNKMYLSNSFIEKNDKENEMIVNLAIVDGNKTFADFLHKRINDVMKEKNEKYKKCDIMYSYEVEGVSDEKNTYSR
ncbi:MAG: sensor histidine kinase [Candidatus Gastranaerophilaceae bacterium]